MSTSQETTPAVKSDDELCPQRVNLPKLVLFAFHGTIAPQNWEDLAIFPYLRDNLKTYLADSWSTNAQVSGLIELLTQQSFDEHFVFERNDAPVIPNRQPSPSPGVRIQLRFMATRTKCHLSGCSQSCAFLLAGWLSKEID